MSLPIGVMPPSTSSLDSRKPGVRLIGGGLAIVVLAQFVSGIPLATAMAVIAWGVVLTLRSDVSAVVNLCVYAVLVGYTVGSQSHAAYLSPSGLSHLTSLDHVLALVLLAALAWVTLQRAAAAAQ